MTEETPGPRAVRVLARDAGVFEEALKAQIDAYDAPVEVRFVGIDELHEALLASEPDYDVTLLVTDWLPELRALGRLTALAPDVTATGARDWPENWPEDWTSSLCDVVTDAEGRVWALPYHQGPVMLLYRTDLFGSAAEQRRFEAEHGRPLTLPQTWNEVVEVARFFTRPDEGLWGTIQAGYPDAHNNLYDFLLHLWSRGGSLLDASGAPSFDSPAGEGALRFLHDLWHVHRVVDPSALRWNSVESGERFAAGEAAFMVNWCGFASYSALPGSPTAGLVGCAPPPACRPGGDRVSINVFWAMAMSTAARDREAAWRFLRHVASPAMDMVTTRVGAAGARRSTWQAPEARAMAPYYAVLEEVHRSARPLPSLPGFARLAEVLSEMVDDVINQRSAPAEALHRASGQVAVLDLAGIDGRG